MIVACSTKKATPQPSADEIRAAAKQLVLENSGDVGVESVEDVKVARDLNGQWWVSALVIPEESARTDNAIIFMVRKDNHWELVDLGTGVVPGELPLPDEVRIYLRQ